MNVLTLIANPKDLKLDDKIINSNIIALEKAKARIENIGFLKEHQALDIFFSTDKAKSANQSIYQTISQIIADNLKNKLHDIPLDYCVQATTNRQKKLLICDMDSTIIQQECIDEIAAKIGIKEKVAAITERAMNGELDFKQALAERVALLKGVSEQDLEDVYNKQIELMPGAVELIKTMNDNGAHTMLVSGGFTFFTQKIALRLGFKEQSANILEIKDKKLTGKVVEPILDKDAKLAALNNGLKALKLNASDAMAVGDGANDLPMLQAAGLGIAYHAKKFVQDNVQYRINYTDLTSLLYVQGLKG